MVKEVKVKVRECPKCEELHPIEEFSRCECFRLSDFKDMADDDEELIKAEDVLKLNFSYTLEVNKCDYCEKLFEDFQEEEKEMWENEYGEYYDTKREAEENE